MLSAGDRDRVLLDALAGAVLEGQGGDGARWPGCRQHGHTGSPAAGGCVKSHSFPPKKERGSLRGQVPCLAVSRHSCPGCWSHSRCQTLGGTQGTGDACVPHDGDTILGVHKAGRPAAAFSAPDFYHLEEGG